MTLLIAGKERDSVWMVADTAISGGPTAIRERHYRPKIEPVGSSGLVGYAGDQHHGERILRAARNQVPGSATVEFLLSSHCQIPSVDFAYAYKINGDYYLFRISQEKAEEVSVLHLGEDGVFEHFQRIRHSGDIDHAPDAIHRFIFAARHPDIPPQALVDSTHSLLRLFPATTERSVGGWPTPYLLTDNGVALCTYVYAVTDPVVDALAPGSIIPAGTAEGGGFGMCFTALKESDGMVVYWEQMRYGRVYFEADIGYTEQKYFGMPNKFKSDVMANTGREIDLWFNENPIGVPESVSYLNDEHGRPRLAVARSGRTISFAWVQGGGGAFRTKSKINPSETAPLPAAPDPEKPMRLNTFMSEDKKSATLTLSLRDEPLGHIILSASELETLIRNLSKIRAEMYAPVSFELRDGTELDCALDPIWRTRIPPTRQYRDPFLRFVIRDTVGLALFYLTRRPHRSGVGWLIGPE